jgi:hypothetical protein
MAEAQGRFEKGVWVAGTTPPAPQANGAAIEKRISEAAKAVASSVDTAMGVARDLVATPEGKQYIEKTLKETQAQIQQSFDAVISRAKAELEKGRQK